MRLSLSPLPSRRRLTLALGAAVLALISAAPAALAQEQVVNLYSARHYDSDNKIYQAFTAKTGIKVNEVSAEADQLIQRIKAEGSASPADVLITVDAGRLQRAVDAGVLAPTRDKGLEDAIPAVLRHPDGLWFGVTRRVRIIVVNKDKPELAQIKTYADLADPKWKGRLCIRSSGNVYNQSLVGAMIEVLGPAKTADWAKGIVANLARKPEGGDSDQIKAIKAGVCDIAVTNHYYLARLLASAKPEDKAAGESVKVIFPDQDAEGAHVNISGVGIVKGAPHAENARKFLQFLMSDEAQKIFADGSFEFPMSDKVEPHAILKGFGSFKAAEVSAETFGRNNPAALKLMEAAGWR